MKISYDKGSDAAYIEFDVEGDSPEFDRVEGEWPINVDVAKDGRVIGIEILDASVIMNAQYLEEATNAPQTKVQKYLEQKKKQQNDE